MLCLPDARPESRAEYREFTAALAQRGFTEGANLKIERAGGTSMEARALAEAAQALVARRPDVLTSWCGTSGALAAKAAAKGLPVVFSSSADPVALGLVASLARPGGNVTGFSARSFETGAKGLEYLVEAKRSIKRVAVVHHSSSLQLPWYVGFRAALERAAQQLGVAIQFSPVADAGGLEPEFERLVKSHVDAVQVLGGIQSPPRFFEKVCELALKHRLPSAGGTARLRAGAGALVGFVDETGAASRRMARYVARILQGTKPGELPIEQVDPPGLSIDLRVARALGLTFPPALLARATEVLE